MAKNGVIAALDIGTSKIVCAIGYVGTSGEVKVTGVGHQLARGIRAGVITDVKQAESSILSAVNAAEQMAGESVDHVVVNMSGHHLSSCLLKIDTSMSGHEITGRDIHHVSQKGYEQCQEAGKEVIHYFPVEYVIDGTAGIMNPQGMYGEKLTTTLHIIKTPASLVRNLVSCFIRCHLNVEELLVSGYSAGLVCLKDDEKTLGTILLDIGAGSTAISVFSEGKMVYVDSIAVGSEYITRDLAYGLSCSLVEAERVKVLHGSALSSIVDARETIALSESEEGDQERQYVSKSDISAIIKPRVEELFETVKHNLEQSHIASQLSGVNVVLTGGGSQLQGIRELASHVLDRRVRHARPVAPEGLPESLKGPAFAACIGTLQHCADSYVGGKGGTAKSSSDSNQNPIHRIVNWFKGM